MLPDTLSASDLIDVTKLSRETIRDMFLDSFDDPLNPNRGGRPPAGRGESILSKMVVAEEFYASGKLHFHVEIPIVGGDLGLTEARVFSARCLWPGSFMRAASSTSTWL